ARGRCVCPGHPSILDSTCLADGQIRDADDSRMGTERGRHHVRPQVRGCPAGKIPDRFNEAFGQADATADDDPVDVQHRLYIAAKPRYPARAVAHDVAGPLVASRSSAKDPLGVDLKSELARLLRHPAAAQPVLQPLPFVGASDLPEMASYALQQPAA